MDIYILRDGEETGPYSEDAAQGLLAQGVAAATDLAWRPGMPKWIPLEELLQPAPGAMSDPELESAAEVISAAPAPDPALAAPEPEPADPGLAAAPARMEPAASVSTPPPSTPPAVSGEPATAKQKAFLTYLGIAFPASATREQAALLVNDALENPKDTVRLTRWNDDRLRLHPELFAAELQAKKEGRAQHYFELTQSEGAECFDGVTKAHCQVLVGFLDLSHPNWDANEREAAWNYFFPAIAEKFPQVVRKEWRGKLAYPQGPKIAREMKRPAAAAGAARVARGKPGPSPLAALVKGLVYGAIVLGIGAGGYYLWQHPEHVIAARKQIEKTFAGSKSAGTARAGKAAQEDKSDTTPAPASAASSAGSADSLFGPSAASPSSTEAGSPPAMAAAPPVPGDAMNAAPAGSEPAAGNMAAPPGDVPLFDPGTASASPTANGSGSLFAPATPPPTPAVAPRTKVTLTKSIDVQTTYGKVTVPAGTVLKLVSQEGDAVQVSYANSVIAIPVASTDLGDPAAPPAPGQ